MTGRLQLTLHQEFGQLSYWDTIRLSRCLPEFGEVPTLNPASALTSLPQYSLRWELFDLTQYSVALSTPQD